MYSPVLALLERAGLVTICIAGIMLLLRSTKTEPVADLSLLCAIDWWPLVAGGLMVLEHPLSTSDCTRSVPEGSC